MQSAASSSIDASRRAQAATLFFIFMPSFPDVTMPISALATTLNANESASVKPAIAELCAVNK